MSQILFKTADNKREIMAGYDYPLAQTFFAVFNLEVKEDEDELIYSSMYDKAGPRTAEEVLKKMHDTGITYTKEFVDTLYEHERTQERNALVRL